MGLSGWPHDFPNKSKMADGGHIEFRESANICVLDEDRRKMQYGADYNNYKTAFRTRKIY